MNRETVFCNIFNGKYQFTIGMDEDGKINVYVRWMEKLEAPHLWQGTFKDLIKKLID